MLNVIVHLRSTTPFFFSGRPTRARAPLTLLSPSPAARRAPLVSATTSRHCSRGPPVSLTPTPLFGRQCAHGAHHARPLVSSRSRSAGGPCLCPPSSPRWPRRPTPPTPSCLTRPLSKRSRTMPPRLGPFSLLHPHFEHPRQTPSPSVRPALGALFPRPNYSRSTAAVHPLGEPPTELFPRQSRSHLTSLSPTPWCRARAPSSMTTVPAPPPSIATAPRRPTAPPPRRASPTADLLARRHPGTPPMLAGSTLSLASPHRATARVAAGHVGHFPRWAESPGCGLVVVSAGRVWQAAAPRGL
jgi:hypothetical protein